MMTIREAEVVNQAHSTENAERLERLLAEDHAELDELLRALIAALDEADAVAALARLDLFWARLAVHIRAENLHLFPAMLAAPVAEAAESERRTAAPGKTRAAIAQLRGDHDFFMHELARAVKALREVAGTPGDERASGVMRDAGRSVRALAERLAAHNRLEEGHVYRLPAIILGAAERSELAANVERELRNLPPRFG